MPEPHRNRGAILIVLSATAFGTLAIFARVAYAAGVEPLSLLFLRFLIASAAMIALLLIRHVSIPRGRTLLGLVLLGAIGYVGQSLSFFTALTMASAGVVALLLYLYPAIVTIFAALFLGDRMTPRRLVAVVLALGGSALTVDLSGGARPLGIVLGVAAAVIYAVYILVGSRVTAGVDPIASTTVIITSAAAVYGVVVGIRGLHLPQTTAGWFAVVGVALIATVVAIGLFFAGLEQVGPSTASTLSTLEPAVTLALASTFLGETIRPLQITGGALILAGVVVLARESSKGGWQSAPPEC